MPDHADWPITQRRLARALRSTVYAFAALAALGVIIWRPAEIEHVLGNMGLTLLACMGVLAGLLALLGTLTHAWKVEWVAAWWVAASFGAYTAIDWWSVYAGSHGRMAGAAVTTALTAAIAARGVDLWVFSIETTQARKARVKSWRWQAKRAGFDL